MNNEIITVYTQVYNAAPYLEQCVSSVLSQNYGNFEYIIVDNGSTDNSREILERFEAQDSRIRLFKYDSNIRSFLVTLLKEQGSGKYLTILDSDDWLEPDYLKRMVLLMETENADIVCTGTRMHVEGTKQVSDRSIQQKLVLNRTEYSSAFPYYHCFFRAVWAKMIRMDTFRDSDILPIINQHLPYGGDTLMCFAMLQNANRICIDTSILHHYRIHNKSSSYQYDPKRFYTDVYLNNNAIEFLCQFGPVNEENRQFLSIVYINAIMDTSRVLHNSSLSLEDKLKEYRAIAEHPITQASFRQYINELEAQHKVLLSQILNIGAKLPVGENEDFVVAVQALLPCCGTVITRESLPLFLVEPDLMDVLLRDQRDELLERLLDLIEAKRYTKRYDLGKLVQRLAVDHLMLCGISDTTFLRKYRDIYSAVWSGENAIALETMTGLLLEDQVDSAKEIFLLLYLSLAAAGNEASAFIFGNIRLAELYLRQGKKVACHAVLDNLEDMGVEDNEELSWLRQEMEQLP